NSVNFAYAHYGPANITIAGAGLSSLVCPSDPVATEGEDLHPWLYWDFRPPGSRQLLTRYAGNSGILGVWVAPWDPIPFQIEQAHATGVIYTHSAKSIAAIKDGASNTMLFSEHDCSFLKTLNTQNFPEVKYWWNSGFWMHTTFNGGGPPN